MISTPAATDSTLECMGGERKGNGSKWQPFYRWLEGRIDGVAAWEAGQYSSDVILLRSVKVLIHEIR